MSKPNKLEQRIERLEYNLKITDKNQITLYLVAVGISLLFFIVLNLNDYTLDKKIDRLEYQLGTFHQVCKNETIFENQFNITYSFSDGTSLTRYANISYLNQTCEWKK